MLCRKFWVIIVGCGGGTRQVQAINMDKLLNRAILNSDGCLEWQGAKTNRGYGRVKINKKSYLVHRLIFCIKNNLEYSGEFVICHKCDNPKCINPEHLFKGTQSENMKDSYQKGRTVIPKNAIHFQKGHIPKNRNVKNPEIIKKAIKNRTTTLKQIAEKNAPLLMLV